MTVGAVRSVYSGHVKLEMGKVRTTVNSCESLKTILYGKVPIWSEAVLEAMVVTTAATANKWEAKSGAELVAIGV